MSLACVAIVYLFRMVYENDDHMTCQHFTNKYKIYNKEYLCIHTLLHCSGDLACNK